MGDDYKQLLVWQKSMDLVVRIYELTKHFPADERFGLVNQMRRAAVSVASNIAEGQGRRSYQDFIRFCRIANGSRQELETQCLCASRLGFLKAADLDETYSRTDEIGRLLFGLIASLIRQTKSDRS